jgi:serine/threonine protein kinase
LETDQYSGTRLYMPPENSFSEGKKLVKTQAADIWAVGISLLIMVTGETPEYKNN